MLSRDELSNGIPFILKLPDGSGGTAYWIETLRGNVALRWHEIYRSSDWDALRTQGKQVFQNRVSEAEAERVRRSSRCVVIHAESVTPDQIRPAPLLAPPREPGWENEGGSLKASGAQVG